MARVTTPQASAAFISDPNSLARNSGRQVDWANVSATNADGKKIVPAGTVVGELLGGGLVSPRVVTTNPATGILLTNATEDSDTDSLSGYGVLVGGVLFENLLPDATGTPKTLASAVKTELNSAGCRFTFEQYGDDRS